MDISIHALREEGDWKDHSEENGIEVFLSTPSARRATKLTEKKQMPITFLSTPSARRATVDRFRFSCCHVISIHALREEGDLGLYRTGSPFVHFYPRPPRGGRRATSTSRKTGSGFLSTPSARRATSVSCMLSVAVLISIHALREEGDLVTTSDSRPKSAFLSTPSARRATRPKISRGGIRLYFYPRPPRGGRPDDAGTEANAGTISIHALREEGDHDYFTSCLPSPLFLSTPSARRATR